MTMENNITYGIYWIKITNFGDASWDKDKPILLYLESLDETEELAIAIAKSSAAKGRNVGIIKLGSAYETDRLIGFVAYGMLHTNDQNYWTNINGNVFACKKVIQ